MIRKVHISLPATPFFLTGPGALPALLSSSSLPSSSMALSPAGVAAHPSPRKLAMKLVVICSSALCPSGIPGKRNRTSGLIFRDAIRMIPAFEAISMIPVQNAITPIMVMHSVTASFDESSAALVISCILPLNAPNTIPTRIIPAHR